MKKAKTQKTIEKGRIYITATFNNTLITFTDPTGAPVVSGSCGMHGFTGTRKSTPYAATIVTEATVKKAGDFGFREAVVFVKGIGPGREAALRVIKGSQIEISKIIDVTPIPHNGVRPPKIRRV
ncbi:30S ribosomal protein S11 [Candidatus Microgenomates bacterium]|nr:30S ribosomal protein S11 [Candidatus Microgenomates bacterium]